MIMASPHPSPVRLLGLSGSLRRGSYCTAVLRTLKDRLADKADLSIFYLDRVPLYNQDEDGDGKPEAVVALKQAIADADGLIVISPEYNYGISGVLKNALDWASRPGFKSVLRDKPVLVMTAAPSFTGGVRAQAQLKQTLGATLARVVPTAEVVIAGVDAKVTEGVLTDAAAIKFSLDACDALLREIRAASPASAA